MHLHAPEHLCFVYCPIFREMQNAKITVQPKINSFTPASIAALPYLLQFQQCPSISLELLRIKLIKADVIR